MHDIFSPEPDPLEGMLRPPSPTENETMRQAVYLRTRRVLSRRRRMRQVAYAAALLISFGAGLLVMRMTARSDSGERGASAPRSSEQQRADTRTEQGVDAPRSPRSDDSALAREWDAFDSDEHRGEKYVQAGDRYLAEENDPQSALRCYGNALDSGNEEDLTISPNDNWLLMAIKDARQREKNHAKQGG
jgi:hypothetical protein